MAQPAPYLRLVKSDQPSPSEFQLTIKEFAFAIRQEGKTLGTEEKYVYHLDRLAVWLAGRSVTRPDQLTRPLLREWGAGLYEDWSASTVKQAFCAVRSFLTYCRDEGHVKELLADCLKLPKVEDGEQRVLDVAEIQQVLDYLEAAPRLGVRDRALISLLVDSGLRASEICRVREADLRYGVQIYDPLIDEVVTVNLLSVARKGKRKKQIAHFGDQTADYLRAWQKIRPAWAKADVPELFVSKGGLKPGTALTRDGLRAIVRTIAQRSGVAHFSPHALRRSFAHLLDSAGASSRKVQLYGGWSSLSEVETYTRGLKIDSQYPRYSPVGLIAKLRRTGLEHSTQERSVSESS